MVSIVFQQGSFEVSAARCEVTNCMSDQQGGESVFNECVALHGCTSTRYIFNFFLFMCLCSCFIVTCVY